MRPHRPVSFLPGPVTIPLQVRKVFERAPESHRSDFFIADFQKTRGRLCQLVRSCNVQILLGSGTLANDAVAAQLTLEKKPGLILSNGEFGERLADHAKRFGLTFDTLKFPWGQALDLNVVQQFLSRSPAVGWLWCVHSETSTGMLNPLPVLQSLCAKRGIKVCADCISSIGLVPVNLERIYLASGASGKGLAAYPGLCMVYYNHSIASNTALPRYLDLGWYAEHQGIAFTHSSNLVQALDAAVRQHDWEKKFAEVAEVSIRLRARLRELGFRLLATGAEAMPGVVTIVLPAGTELIGLRPKTAAGRVYAQLQQRLFAPAQLDSNLPDGRILQGQNRVIIDLAEPEPVRRRKTTDGPALLRRHRSDVVHFTAPDWCAPKRFALFASRQRTRQRPGLRQPSAALKTLIIPAQKTGMRSVALPFSFSCKSFGDLLSELS